MSSASQGLGLTRMNIPYMLGTMFTPESRSRQARRLRRAPRSTAGSSRSSTSPPSSRWHRATWWLGGAIGLVHALFVLTVGMRLLPGLHPRMASEQHGPTVARQLEPPGFLALNYGVRTPVVAMVSRTSCSE